MISLGDESTRPTVSRSRGARARLALGPDPPSSTNASVAVTLIRDAEAEVAESVGAVNCTCPEAFLCIILGVFAGISGPVPIIPGSIIITAILNARLRTCVIDAGPKPSTLSNRQAHRDVAPVVVVVVVLHPRRADAPGVDARSGDLAEAHPLTRSNTDVLLVIGIGEAREAALRPPWLRSCSGRAAR